MSEQLIEIKRYGQITVVWVEGIKCYDSGNTQKKEAEHIKSLLDALVIENYKIEVK